MACNLITWHVILFSILFLTTRLLDMTFLSPSKLHALTEEGPHCFSVKVDAIQSVKDVAMILVLPGGEEVPQKQFPRRFSEAKKRLISVDVHKPQVDVSKTASFSSSPESSPREEV